MVVLVMSIFNPHQHAAAMMMRKDASQQVLIEQSDEVEFGLGIDGHYFE